MDSIDQLRADLSSAGRDPGQVQWADQQSSWDEGTIVCEAVASGVVVRQLGRGEHDDSEELFGSEEEAAAALRRRLLSQPTGPALSDAERASVNERMQAKARATLQRLEDNRTDG